MLRPLFRGRWTDSRASRQIISLPARTFGSKASRTEGKAIELSPLQQYDEDVREGKIRSDDNQRRMLGDLNTVYEALENYHPDPIDEASHKGFFSSIGSLFGSSSKPTPHFGPKGIYMYGDVGCGKTMLMDMFYRTVPPHLTKRRIHFHGFMQDVHKRSYTLKQKYGTKIDIADRIAHEEATDAQVLCFDEMQVTDVADAMILRRLFEGLYARGVVTFFTSNREPDELYKNGVQRESFIPCIELIKERDHVVQLVSPTDYRKLPRPSSGSYFFLAEGKEPIKDVAVRKSLAKKHAEKWFEYFAGDQDVVTDRDLEIWGRPVRIPLSAGNNVMQFTFEELCGTPRSAADYLEMCRTFKAAVITEIPEMSLEQRDVLRRFITFLDAAYDSHLKLAASAARPFESLFNTKHLTIDPKTNQVVMQEGAATSAKGVTDPTNFAGHEEMFAFARALSRLKQMSSEQWLNDAPQ